MAGYEIELNREEETELRERYERDRSKVTEADIASAIDEAEDTYDGLLDSSWQRVRWLGQYAKLTHWMLVDWWNGDYRIPTSAIVGLGVALAYFVLPTDVVPDIIPLAGWLDDAMVMGLAAATFDGSLEDYVEEQGVERAEFDAIYEVS